MWDGERRDRDRGGLTNGMRSPRSVEPGRQSAEIKSYGRRRGRTFRQRQQLLLDTKLGDFAVDLSKPAAAQLDACSSSASISASRQTWVEIGFGGAEHIIWQARHNPDVTLIGCEPFLDGVVKAISGIAEYGLSNVRLHADDARPLLRWLPPASVDRVFILFPDPWPKRKHVKRRLVSTATLDLLARVMRPGAELRVGTDIGDYARTILLAVMAHPEFEWPARGPQDWRERPADWPQTRYEEKAIIEGRRSSYFRFRRTFEAASDV